MNRSHLLEELYEEINKMIDSPVELLPNVDKESSFEYKIGVRRGLVIAENLILARINKNENLTTKI